jgi:hypothetical protein
MSDPRQPDLAPEPAAPGERPPRTLDDAYPVSQPPAPASAPDPTNPDSVPVPNDPGVSRAVVRATRQAEAVADRQATKETDGVGDLPPDARARLAIQKAAFREKLVQVEQERQFLAEVTKLTWGKTLSAEGARALAAWGQEADVDPLTEIDILGGSKVYVNANWYLRQLGRLVSVGAVEYAYYEMIHDDPRIEKDMASADAEAKRLRKRATEETDLPEPTRAALRERAGELEIEALNLSREMRRRRRVRQEHAIPDNATAAVLWHVKARALSEETLAAQGAGGYRGKTGDKFKDPVAEEFPRETALTRGARKVMRVLAHIGRERPELKTIPAVQESDRAVDRVEDFSDKVQTHLGRFQAEGLRELRAPHVLNTVAQPADAYAEAAPSTPDAGRE